jgi:L-alanine-DL-glutamate epimerase-like enolase superfamily enzyme
MITGHGFDRSVGETLRYLLPDLMGQTPAEREVIWHRSRHLGTPLVPQAQSLIDIALWDMTANYAGLPLYQLLGGARHKVLSYASTPLLADNQAYIDYVAGASRRVQSRQVSLLVQSGRICRCARRWPSILKARIWR